MIADLEILLYVIAGLIVATVGGRFLHRRLIRPERLRLEYLLNSRTGDVIFVLGAFCRPLQHIAKKTGVKEETVLAILKKLGVPPGWNPRFLPTDTELLHLPFSILQNVIPPQPSPFLSLICKELTDGQKLVLQKINQGGYRISRQQMADGRPVYLVIKGEEVICTWEPTMHEAQASPVSDTLPTPTR